MSPKIPHSKIINSQLEEYLCESVKIVSQSARQLQAKAEYRAIYKNSVGAFTPLTKFSDKQLPLLRTAAGIIKRAPLLIATRQIQLAYTELRRLIEVVSSYPYFFDHKIEWEKFLEEPGNGYSANQDKPIEWAAHRQQSWHVNYIKERFSNDKSGLINEAIQFNMTGYSELSKHVHASLDHITKKPITEVFDEVNSDALNSYSKIQRRIYIATLVLAIAPRKNIVGTLTVMEKAWFDWVLGLGRKNKILAGDFLS